MASVCRPEDPDPSSTFLRILEKTEGSAASAFLSSEGQTTTVTLIEKKCCSTPTVTVAVVDQECCRTPAERVKMKEEEYCCTPTVEEFKIPEVLTCPPAPRKLKVNRFLTAPSREYFPRLKSDAFFAAARGIFDNG